MRSTKTSTKHAYRRSPHLKLLTVAISVLLLCPLLACAHENAATSVSTGKSHERIMPEDLTYLGAFRVPGGKLGKSRFANGGNTLTFRPNGDPRGKNDGYPGSLFLIGHSKQQMVAEISIPVPKISPEKDATGFHIATLLQPFSDITGGKLSEMEWVYPEVGGLAYLSAHPSQPSDQIYWTLFKGYNVAYENHLSHGSSDVTLSTPNASGAWRLGQNPALHTAGYIFTVPKDFADQHFGGRRLISGAGFANKGGITSHGPPMYAFAPWQHPIQPPPHGAELNALPLTYYPYTGNESKSFPGYQRSDRWSGATWITAGKKQAVLIVGRVSLGELRYGKAQPGDCSKYKGYHGDPYEPRFIFYDVNDLAASARGDKKPWRVLPYSIWNPARSLLSHCSWQLSGATYDFDNHLLYVLQPKADMVTSIYALYPLIHVFSIK